MRLQYEEVFKHGSFVLVVRVAQIVPFVSFSKLIIDDVQVSRGYSTDMSHLVGLVYDVDSAAGSVLLNTSTVDQDVIVKVCDLFEHGCGACWKTPLNIRNAIILHVVTRQSMYTGVQCL